MNDEFLILAWDGALYYGGMSAVLPGGTGAPRAIGHPVVAIFEMHTVVAVFLAGD